MPSYFRVFLHLSFNFETPSSGLQICSSYMKAGPEPGGGSEFLILVGAQGPEECFSALPQWVRMDC